MNLLTSSVFDVKIPEYNWENPEVSPEMKYEPNTDKGFRLSDPAHKLIKKRKSLEITPSKPTWDEESKYEPLPFKAYSRGATENTDAWPILEALFDEREVACMRRDLLANQEGEPKRLLFPRKSEDWDSKVLEGPKTFTSFTQKKRQKWSKEELKVLWTSIAMHGNNWSLVNDIMTSRSYYQIKDKGRRVLYEHGWTTGRNKQESELANRDAREIARKLVERTPWLQN